MEVTPQDLIQITLDKIEHEKRMQTTRAQDMKLIAEVARNKSKATYRYSLLMYVHEVIEQRANAGDFSAKISTLNAPWAVSEFEQILPFLKNDGFEVKFDYDHSTIGLQGAMSNLNKNYKILEVSWK